MQRFIFIIRFWFTPTTWSVPMIYSRFIPDAPPDIGNMKNMRASRLMEQPGIGINKTVMAAVNAFVRIILNKLPEFFPAAGARPQIILETFLQRMNDLGFLLLIDFGASKAMHDILRLIDNVSMLRCMNMLFSLSVRIVYGPVVDFLWQRMGSYPFNINIE